MVSAWPGITMLGLCGPTVNIDQESRLTLGVRKRGAFSHDQDPERTLGDPSLDHLVGALLELQRHVEAEGIGGLEMLWGERR
jgi:hypothetical protein